uniref:PDEase domain-containing protein n=1 Tax=Mesocestoides corti TaxID=53468 RepID=A0A5K3F180_MESCO
MIANRYNFQHYLNTNFISAYSIYALNVSLLADNAHPRITKWSKVNKKELKIFSLIRLDSDHHHVCFI